MMDINTDKGTIWVALSEIIAFKPVGDGSQGSQIVLRPNPGVLEGATMVQVKENVGKLVDRYRQGQRVGG